MTLIEFYNLLGYLASILIIISMMMSSLVRLRIVNMIGAFIFSVYGFLIDAYPVGILNGIVVLVNVYQLFKLFRRKEEFRIIQPPINGDYIKAFLEHFKSEIQHFQPDFNFNLDENNVAYIVLRNMNVAGVILGTKLPDNNLKINLDFVIAEYRDLKVGQYIFVENKEYLQSKGIKRIITTAKNQKHQEYLRKMGFTYNSQESIFELKL
ncbi:MAG TPA: GNAT family N-acetyltransferase [Salinivirgaceae bacterium]|nr:GNAT family N-acetyltransferase [Salinivirgaceae bacterium]